MLGVVRAVWGKQPDELFQGDDGVEALCPRCGTRWWLTRELFDTAEEDPDVDKTDI